MVNVDYMNLVWRKSSYSGQGNCVEVAQAEATIFVRDSKNPTVAPLAFRTDEWAAFVSGVRDGEFDLES